MTTTTISTEREDNLINDFLERTKRPPMDLEDKITQTSAHGKETIYGNIVNITALKTSFSLPDYYCDLSSPSCGHMIPVSRDQLLSMSLKEISQVYPDLSPTLRNEINKIFHFDVSQQQQQQQLPMPQSSSSSSSTAKPFVALEVLRETGVIDKLFTGDMKRISAVGPDGRFYTIRKCESYKTKKHAESIASMLFEIRFDFNNMFAWLELPSSIDRNNNPVVKSFIESLNVAFNKYYQITLSKVHQKVNNSPTFDNDNDDAAVTLNDDSDDDDNITTTVVDNNTNDDTDISSITATAAVDSTMTTLSKRVRDNFVMSQQQQNYGDRKRRTSVTAMRMRRKKKGRQKKPLKKKSKKSIASDESDNNNDGHDNNNSDSDDIGKNNSAKMKSSEFSLALPSGAFGVLTKPIYFPPEYDSWVILTNEDMRQLTITDFLKPVPAPLSMLEFYGKTSDTSHATYCLNIDQLKTVYKNDIRKYLDVLTIVTKRRKTPFLIKQICEARKNIAKLKMITN